MAVPDQNLNAAAPAESQHSSSGTGAAALARPPASAGVAGTSSGRARPRVRYVSLFAGIEAASVSMGRVGGADWEPVFFSEIDPFACAVLAHRFPGVPNLGDVTKIRVDAEKGTIENGSGASIPFPDGGIDLLCGGSPCQDVSLAGLRAGFADGTRSSLAFDYARLVGELRPRVLLWENVPGVLSSRGGRDFAALLCRLVELGYGLAWRVLDVQFTRVDGFPRGIPQRRERVWLVGLLGADERAAGEVLFELPGRLGNTPPRREAGKGFAAPAGCGDSREDGGGGAVGRGFDLLSFGQYGEGGAASTVKARDFKDATDLVVMDKEAYNAGENQTGGLGFKSEDASPNLRATGHAPALARPVSPRGAVAVFENHQTDARTVPLDDVSPTMGAERNAQPSNNNPLVVTQYGPDLAGQAVAVGVSFDGRRDAPSIYECSQTQTVGTSPGYKIGLVIGRSAGVNPQDSQCFCAFDETAQTLTVRHGGGVVNCIPIDSMNELSRREAKGVGGGGGFGTANGPSFTLTTRHHHAAAISNHGGVEGDGVRYEIRRLTPVECERLQGFPDKWTRIPYRGKPADQCPDSPRYRALGNSWGCNCAEWILRRLLAFGVWDGDERQAE